MTRAACGFAGSVVDADVEVVLMVDARFELEARNPLAQIGFDRVVGTSTIHSW